MAKFLELVTTESILTIYKHFSGGARNFEKRGEGRSGERGSPLKNSKKKFRYFGFEILSFTHIRW
jgi:hypothetical protein